MKWPKPNLPQVLFIGHERNRQLEIFPVPVESGKTPGAFPYSTRSFTVQAARQLGGCAYSSVHRGDSLGEQVFNDTCWDADDRSEYDYRDEGPATWRCHLLSGWTQGQESCALWDRIGTLCQTEGERKFLHQYLALVKSRNFPMLVPQVRIGIAERRRPDFVLYVPLHQFKYRWYAIELDGGHSTGMAASDELRNRELEAHGYVVLSYRPSTRGYFEEVQRLVERVHVEMDEANHNGSGVAVGLQVRSCEPEINF